MYIQIKKISAEPDKYGSFLKISMIGVYENDGKWIKWLPLTECIEDLKNAKIQIEL